MECSHWSVVKHSFIRFTFHFSASVINFNDDDEDENATPKEKLEENDKMKEKMDKLRVDLDKLNIGKKVGKTNVYLFNATASLKISSWSQSLLGTNLKKILLCQALCPAPKLFISRLVMMH